MTRFSFQNLSEHMLAFIRRAPRRRRGNLTEGLYIGLDYEKVCFAQKKFP